MCAFVLLVSVLGVDRFQVVVFVFGFRAWGWTLLILFNSQTFQSPEVF